MRQATSTLIGIFVAALVVAAATYAIESSRTEQFEATAKIQFVEDTRFDYVDAERDRLVGYASSTDAQGLVNAEGVVSVEYVRPSRETFFDVVVRATDPELAASTANGLAYIIVDAELAAGRERFDREIAALVARNADIEEEMAELQDEVDEASAREAFAEANRFTGDPESVERLTIELRDAQSSLFLMRRFQNRLGVVRDEALIRIGELEVQRSARIAATSVVQPAVAPSDPTAPNPEMAAAVAGSAVATLGLGGFFLWRPRRLEEDTDDE
jgi:uncharacterized protein involved in exopolysaccharide biosynthesis